MISKPFRIFVLVSAILAGVTGAVALRLDNARLRKQVATLRKQNVQTTSTRQDVQRTRNLVARMEADESDGARAVHADLVRARTEVEALEQRARERLAQIRIQIGKDTESLANNRDPEKGLTQLENFQNVGQGTPSAAFQTFVWAAFKGEDERLAAMIAIDRTGREKAEAIVAALPEELRAKYPTPEKLAALFFAGLFTGLPAAEVIDVSFQDSQHAMVSVRGLTDKTQKLPLQLGPDGWQIVLTEGMVGKLEGWARGAEPARAGKGQGDP